jgi:hypothetical protein
MEKENKGSLSASEKKLIYQWVKSSALEELVQSAKEKGNWIFNVLISDPNGKYPNEGSVLHWAAWFRHWSVLRLALNFGANLTIRGTGSYMNNKTPLDYATFLDQKCGHIYYCHEKKFLKAQHNCIVKLTLGVIPQNYFVAISSEQTRRFLRALVRINDIKSLENAIQKFGDTLGETLLEGGINNGTLAHWAIWYRHWDVLKCLITFGCYSLTIRGTGAGWMSNRTLETYAKLLDDKCLHPYYEHSSNLEKLLLPAAGEKQNTIPSAGSGNALCCVDLTSPRECMFRPCNHLCVCLPCSKAILATSKKCPICRADVVAADRVYT